MAFTATITSKGQITIPRAARKALNSTTVEIEIQGDMVILRPVKSVAGALAKYAEGIEPLPFHEVREKVWEEVVTVQRYNKSGQGCACRCT